MIAFVQPFGLTSPGGGARILRAVLADAPEPYLVVCTGPHAEAPTDHEAHLPLRPAFGFIERTRLVNTLGVRRLDTALGHRFERRLEALCLDRGVTGIHAIPHGMDFWYAYTVAQTLGIPYYLNVHDDMSYNLREYPYLERAMERLAHVWSHADGRLVISEAMGEEYSRRYGAQPYVVVTDGLQSVAPEPRPSRAGRMRVYMMGSVHRSYEANFRALLDALGQLRQARPDWDLSLRMRGGAPFPVDRDDVRVDVLPWGTEADVERDLDDADLLYLPLPFEEEYAAFTRYSLPTKMVTYLGSGLPILYHGPPESAAGRLLDQHRAALCVTSLRPDDLVGCLIDAQGSTDDRVERALALGRSQFALADQRETLWRTLRPEPVGAGVSAGRASASAAVPDPP